MKYIRWAFVLMLVSAAGCDDGPFRTPWHAEKLASGSTIKVTSLNLVWGAEHDEHTLARTASTSNTSRCIRMRMRMHGEPKQPKCSS